MKRILILLVALTSMTSVMAQKKLTASKIGIDAPGDHLMAEVSYDRWLGATDSINSHTKGFSRGLNIYFMLNKPFKTDPHWSVAFGLGIGSSNMVFKKMSVDLTATGNTLPFTALDSTNHFKKFKLSTSYVEIPVELRYTFHPEDLKKSWKIAFGAKVGTMINAHTKGKIWQDKNNNTLINYIVKEDRKTFLNGTKVAATLRVGMGNYSVFGSYQITSLLKDGAGPVIHPIQIGFCLSGL